jgi:Flp pilus assembly protein TadG
MRDQVAGLRIDRRLVATDRGAVAVIVALLMVVLIGFVALVVDVGRMHVQKVQLQNGADAGALAIANECARTGISACSATAAGLADSFAEKNNNTLFADASHGFPGSGGTVVVNTAAMDGDGLGMPLYFAPIFNVNRAYPKAQATATWGGPSKGNGAIPLAFAQCQFNFTGAVQLLKNKGSGTSSACDDRNKSGQTLPGGFEWLVPDSVAAGGNGCFSNVTALTFEPAENTGANVPSGCKTVLESLQGKTIILPVYDEISPTQGYHIKGLAAFTLLGYNFPGLSWNNRNHSGLDNCTGDCSGVYGRFVKMIDAGDIEFSSGGPNELGVSLVRLTG